VGARIPSRAFFQSITPTISFKKVLQFIGFLLVVWFFWFIFVRHFKNQPGRVEIRIFNAFAYSRTALRGFCEGIFFKTWKKIRLRW
jgi:hypothetical protein